MTSYDFMIFCRDSQSNRNSIFDFLTEISIIGFNHFPHDNIYCFTICGKIQTVFELSGKLTKFNCDEKTFDLLELYKARKLFLEMMLNR